MNERAGVLLLLFIAVVAFVLFAGPLTHGEVLTFRDHSDYFVPLRFFTAVHLRAWRLPLWNPYNASGEPWMANPQTAVFYPPTWMFVALPFRTAYVAFLAFHLALLGCGAYVLFSRTVSRGAATFGAIALMLCGPVLSMLDVGDNLASFAWLPLVIWCALPGRTPVAVRWRQALAPVMLAFCFLAGEPFIAAIAAVLYALTVRRVREIAITAVFTTGLTAVQLLPFLELVRGSDRRGGFAGHEILRDSMAFTDWWRVAVPPRTTEAGYDAALSQHFIPIVYVGVMTAALAIVGAMVGARRRRAAVLSWLALLVVSMIVAAGPSFLASLPITILRYPARMVPFGAFALVALAVIGWDRVRHNRPWLDALVILVVICDLLPPSLALLRSGPMPQVPYDRSIGGDAKIVRLDDVAALRRGESRQAWIAGYLNLLDRRFDAWTAAPVTSQRYADLYARALHDRALMGRIGAGYVLSSLPLTGEGIVPLERTEGVYATKLSDAQPMARVIAPDGSVVSVRGLALDSAHARVIADTPAGGLVVLTQCDASGWRAEVDGVRTPSEVSDGVFRAARIGPGHHEVRWSYAPRSLQVGGAITIAALVAMIAFIVHSRSR